MDGSSPATESPRRGKRALLAALLAGGILILFVVLGNKKPPPVPRDAPHAGARDVEDCLRCHGPDGERPRGPKHPLRNDCWSCHAWSPAN